MGSASSRGGTGRARGGGGGENEPRGEPLTAPPKAPRGARPLPKPATLFIRLPAVPPLASSAAGAGASLAGAGAAPPPPRNFARGSRAGRGRPGWVSEGKPPLRASELGAGRCPASLLPTPPHGPGGGDLPLPAPGWPPLLVPSARPRGAPRGTSALSRLPEGAAPPHVPGSWQVALMLRLGWLPRSCYRGGLPPKPKIAPVPGPPRFQTRKIRFRCSRVLAAAKCFLFEKDQPALYSATWRASCLARLTWGMRFSSQHMLPEGTCLSF